MTDTEDDPKPCGLQVKLKGYVVGGNICTEEKREGKFLYASYDEHQCKGVEPNYEATFTERDHFLPRLI